MSLFEKYLALGQWISQEEQLALYKYLSRTKASAYRDDAKRLLAEGELIRQIADGEILYRVLRNKLIYRAKEMNRAEYSEVIREVNLSRFHSVNISKFVKFFAQAEVDVICNYPLPGIDQEAGSGFNWVVFPCYDLNYYSRGKGKVKGFLMKLRAKDHELLQKLLAS